ncbi:MAG: hypothetical protein JJ974_12005 [Phycisphaerales bacterium]|nr:hypothetical protein [Phycisphaerales bacterium]
MKNAVWIWIVRVLSLCVFGPIAGGLMASLRGVDGSRHATLFVSDSILGGLFVLFGVFFLAMIAGVIATKMVSLREGVLNLGLVLGWGAWGAGEVGEALRSAPDSGSIVKLAIEGFAVLVLTVWMLRVMTKVRGVGDGGDEGTDGCVALSNSKLVALREHAGLTGMLVGVGLVVSMVMVWLQVQSDLSGQAVWGGFIGSAAAGVLGGMLIQNHSMGSSGKHGRGGKRSSDGVVSLIPVMVGVMLGGVFGPLVGMVTPGSGRLLQAIASGEMPGFLVMSSVSWAAGAMIGTPVGYSWVESSVARQQANTASA